MKLPIKLPKTDSVADRIGKLLHKKESLPSADIREFLVGRGCSSDTIYSVIVDMTKDGQILKHGESFILADYLRNHYSNLNHKANWVGEVVPPRDESLYRKAWSGAFSLANAVRREPLREIGFITSNTSAEPVWGDLIMSAFKRGEICILQHTVFRRDLEGEEVVIEDGPCECLGKQTRHVFVGYLVTTSDGSEYAVYPHQLRRKPPKSDDAEWAASKVRDLLKVQPEKVAA